MLKVSDIKQIFKYIADAAADSLERESIKLQGWSVGGAMYNRFTVPSLIDGIQQIHKIASPVSADNAVAKLSEIEDICIKLMADGGL